MTGPALSPGGSERTPRIRPAAAPGPSPPSGGGETAPAGAPAADAALQALLETVSETGERFFRSLVRNLAAALDVRGAWVTEFLRERRRLRAIAFWLNGDWVPDYEYDLEGTPCAEVVDRCDLVHLPERAMELYPRDPDLRNLGAVSYLGVPLLDLDGRVLGHLAVLDTRPLPADPRCLAIFQIFAGRAAAELRRVQAEARVSARDDEIRRLSDETAYLREELRDAQGAGDILGRSEALRAVLRAVTQVADTDATVLVLGETGTGKELIARAVHARSRRRNGPFVKVNCAALPESLIESELFGHEKGAFTGATRQRDGRFALADGGTLFLDEIGELPPSVQVKLLRVLQEGEFEPVGSSRTRRVDVRVVAATNRDLGAAVARGEFRGDLFFRLNVFPVRVPPLRERGEDVVILARAFVERFAARLGRRVEALPSEAERSLLSYPWPGNVRELQNVIERAVITSRSGRLHVDLAAAEPPSTPAADAGRAAPAADRVLTAAEVRELERLNILRALEEARWRIAGPDGAAARLGMKPSTLASRIKALGLRRDLA